jgi:two-component system, NarL family, response regulator LiaR
VSANIRVLIVDDHKVVRDGLRVFLAPIANIEVVGEAKDGFEAVIQAETLHPEIILMDLLMPGMDGIEATRTLKQKSSQSQVIVLTSSAEDEKAIAAVRVGAMGYLLKDSTPLELQKAIQDVHQGGSALPQHITNKIIRGLTRPESQPVTSAILTDREIEILKMVATGLSNQEIADQLVISVWTVRTHLTSILTKLRLENRTQATLFALREGLVKLEK